jgi:hypothetical protein
MSSKPFLDLPFDPNKSEVFFSAVPDEMKAQILGILQFREGSLLVRYSVLPLIPGVSEIFSDNKGKADQY